MSAPSNANETCVGPAAENAGKASSCAGCPNQSACASGAGKQETVVGLGNFLSILFLSLSLYIYIYPHHSWLNR